MYNVQFSVLYNYPSLVNKDCISIAVLFFNTDTKECRLRTISNWKRVQKFNDKLDIELVKLQLHGMEKEIHEIAKRSNFELKDYTKFYTNVLKFSDIVEIKTTNFDEFVDKCSRQYLFLDYNKK